MVLFYADVAQQEAQQTFNLWATGSIPVIRTMSGSETALFDVHMVHFRAAHSWGVGREAECSGLLNRRAATFHRFESYTPRHEVVDKAKTVSTVRTSD